MKAVIVDSQTLLPLFEVPFESVSVTDELNGGGDGDIRVVFADPDLVGFTTPWMYSLGITTDAYEPLWLGAIVKPRGTAGSGVYEVFCQQWESYLDRVYLPDKYDGGGEADAGQIIADRLTDTVSFARELGAMPVPLPVTPPALCGDAEYDFASTFSTDGYWSGPPTTVADDVGSITAQGFVYGFEVGLDAARWQQRLHVAKLPSDPTETVQVGIDVADVELGRDGGAQATAWWVVADGQVTQRIQAYNRPLLMGMQDSDFSGSAAAFADALLASTLNAPLVADDVTLMGVRRFRPGDLVTLDVPAGHFTPWPDGTRWVMRVQAVTWTHDASGERTLLRLVQPLDEVSPVLLRQPSLPQTLTDIRSRLARVETRSRNVP